MAEKTQRINAYKTGAVQAAKEIIQNAQDLIFTEYRGMTVSQLTDLRKKLRAEQASYKVVKNNYMNLAMKELGKPDMSAYLKGPTGVTFISRDAGPVAKILVEFTKEMSLVLKGGLIEGKEFDKNGVTAFAKMPSRKDMYAKMLGTLKAPASNFVFVLNGVISKLVRTVKAVGEKKA
ncbi:MAG: 50S ribosomal protein L10 [Spirochaetales bacterium]|nr:50S ribosomal protein L10 [Spirochaetales bacterium]